MSNLSFGAGYWKKQLPLTVLSYLSSFIAIVTDLSLPLLTAAMLDYAVCYDPSKAAGTPDGIFGFLFTGKYGALGTMKLFLSCAAVFLVILLLRLIFIYIKNISFQRAGLRMESDLRDDTYKKLMQLDGSALSGFNTGELMTVMNRDIVMVKEMYTRVFISFFDSVTVMIVTCIFLSSISPWMLLIPVAISPALIFTLIRYARTMKVIFTDVRRAYSDINLTVQENIRGVRLVRAFANETYEEEKFRRDNYRMRDVMFRLDDKMAKYNTFFDGFMQIAYVSAIIICVFLVLNGSLMVGALTAAGAYVMKIMSHITQISQNISNMQRQTVSLGRLKNFLETESGIREYPEALCASARPHIRMENVSLTLGDKQVLKNITLDIPYGKKVGIMGGTGSGKSVLLKSLSRVFDVTSGEISIDGQNVRKYALDALRNEFAYVFQDVFLFSHTIDANIAFYDPEAPEEDVRDAAGNRAGGTVCGKAGGRLRDGGGRTRARLIGRTETAAFRRAGPHEARARAHSRRRLQRAGYGHGEKASEGRKGKDARKHPADRRAPRLLRHGLRRDRLSSGRGNRRKGNGEGADLARRAVCFHLPHADGGRTAGRFLLRKGGLI